VPVRDCGTEELGDDAGQKDAGVTETDSCSPSHESQASGDPAFLSAVGIARAQTSDFNESDDERHRVNDHGCRGPAVNYEYQRFLADTDYSSLPTSWKFGHYPHERANHPVWSVSETAASMYASWLSQRLGRRFRLPTEVEWEYAACGGEDREYPWGNIFHQDAANTIESGPLSTTPVGMYPAGRSLFGVDDLSGNVEEYVAGNYAPYPDTIRTDDDLTISRVFVNESALWLVGIGVKVSCR
jgi:formylglycine-generating enzyme required for sulfatase activity